MKLNIDFLVGFGFGLASRNVKQFETAKKGKFIITASAGFRMLYNLHSFDGAMKLFFIPEFIYEYSKLSFNTDKIVQIYSKYYKDNYVLLNNDRTFNGSILSNDLSSLTKYDEKDVKIEKTQDTYVNELELSNRQLANRNLTLLNEIGEKDGKTISASEKEGLFYDRIRYIDKEIENDKNLLDNYKKTNFAKTDLGKKYVDLQSKIKEKSDYLALDLKVGKTTKKVEEWYNELIKDDGKYEGKDNNLLILLLRMRDFEKDIQSLEKELSGMLNELKDEITKLNTLKTEINNNIVNNKAEISANEKKIEKNKDNIKDSLKKPAYTEYKYQNYYFSSNISSMFSYSMKMGIEFYRVSPYIKIAFGGMVTDNLFVMGGVDFKEVLLNAETGEYNLYYMDEYSSQKRKKKTSLMYGVGFGVSFRVTDNFSFFAEYVYKTSRYNISFQENIEKTFVYNIHSISAGIMCFF